MLFALIATQNSDVIHPLSEVSDVGFENAPVANTELSCCLRAHMCFVGSKKGFAWHKFSESGVALSFVDLRSISTEAIKTHVGRKIGTRCLLA